MRHVWACKIVVDTNEPLPPGFDFPPRCAAIEAVEEAGLEVKACFSGWDKSLTEAETALVDSKGPRKTLAEFEKRLESKRPGREKASTYEELSRALEWSEKHPQCAVCTKFKPGTNGGVNEGHEEECPNQ